jgi:hypothetical protein
VDIEPRVMQLEGTLSPQEIALLDLQEINEALRAGAKIRSETGKWSEPITRGSSYTG